MSLVYKIEAGATMPALTVPKVGGGEITIGSSDGWQMIVVYRGKHCPICRTYLKSLDRLLDDFHGLGTEVIAVSGDPQGKAESEVAEEGWRIPIGYGLSVDQMRVLGLYISEPRSPEETTAPSQNPGCSSSTRTGGYKSSISPMPPSRGPNSMAC